jgi:quercetin dioxygenase-like cupin family protein
MRQFLSSAAAYAPSGVVDVARWEQYDLDGVLPFQAMWYTVPPASSSPEDSHPEVELSVVVAGTASVETGGQVTEVPQGGAFLLDGGESHVIRNPSPDVPLMVFTTFWLPLESSRP